LYDPVWVGELLGGQVTEGVVRADAVVITSPRFDDASYLVKVHEEVFILYITAPTGAGKPSLLHLRWFIRKKPVTVSHHNSLLFTALYTDSPPNKT
jgi:hypothetical protein